MKQILFSYVDTCLVSKPEIQNNIEILKDEQAKILDSLKFGYDSEYASSNLADDKNLHKIVSALVEKKKLLKPKVLVVIGIGGSNLGTQAVFQAIKGMFNNDLYNKLISDSDFDKDLKVYFADTIQQDYTRSVLKIVERELCIGNNVILNVISKSGTTTETIVNFALFLDLLKQYKPKNYQEYIVVTTDKDSKLYKVAQEERFSLLEIPKNVGGRYSVLSAVGLFPLELLGIDTESLCVGARDMRDSCLNPDNPERDSEAHNIAMISASVLFEHYKNKINIHDIFVFSPNFFALGQWYRQLVGESLGKQFNNSGEEVFVGFAPTVSVGSTDLHSVAQLYLGGPYDKFTTFVSVEKHNISDINVPDFKELNKLVPEIKNKTVGNVLEAIFSGTCQAYKNSKRPYVSIIFSEASEYYLGQFLQFKMLEVIYLAKLLEINPFDQPQVELYKIETRNCLTSI